MRRITVIAGHYGSGKTELAVSLAMKLAKKREYPHLALVDMDVANPYFRSRERRELLEKNGVHVYSDTFGTDFTAELPALTAALRAPLEDAECQTIIDLGGNDAGARVLRQFGKYFEGDQHALWCVVNFRRYETRDVETAEEHVLSIQRELQMEVTGLINNTHLLRETTAEIIREGHALSQALSEKMGKPLLATCFPEEIVAENQLAGIGNLMPLGLYMRPTYLDK